MTHETKWLFPKQSLQPTFLSAAQGKGSTPPPSLTPPSLSLEEEATIGAEMLGHRRRTLSHLESQGYSSPRLARSRPEEKVCAPLRFCGIHNATYKTRWLEQQVGMKSTWTNYQEAFFSRDQGKQPILPWEWSGNLINLTTKEEK